MITLKQYLPLALLITVWSSCIKPITYKEATDALIKKYDKTDFSLFNQFYIHYQSSGNNINSKIYFAGVRVKGFNCAPYAVEHSKFIIMDFFDISNKLVLQSNCSDYMSDNQIKHMTSAIDEYDFFMIEADSVGNVYIRPYESDHHVLLRSVPSPQKSVLEGFKHYKGRWYIHESALSKLQSEQ
ncbi:hypothetical protein LJ707_12370 [Mucilaginibacter sp. UR6-1]|uniref:hypothetical protein n=1 Tax=Mucilaginibacter sp. UR6-1 TaxID=1435643 RepID=UPI001E4FC6D9|nr:hypothetical protein [Mucilaginibacter sp. UR6-1]MCC8409725.1 hypothetical protein [Mucilaginibacter sp. UR6-1]